MRSASCSGRGTPRVVDVGAARAIVAALPPFVTMVGLFVDPDAGRRCARCSTRCRSTCCSSTAAKPPAFCRAFGRRYLKAIAVKDGRRFARIRVRRTTTRPALLFDAYRAGRPARRHRAARSTGRGCRRRARALRAVVLSGGLDAGNVGARDPRRAAVGRRRVDAASRSCGADGKPRRGHQGCRAHRGVRRRECAMQMADLPSCYDLPDERGHFGPYGGVFVAETLIRALDELKAQYARYRDDPEFVAEFERELKHYVGRPSPVYHAERWSRELGGAQIWLKREDLNHTGAHKINNCIGQALLARRMGKPRVIAETGAGQHGVATATVAARFGMECVVYMGSEDVERQAQNVYRMKLLGATVVPVESGSKTLKDALNEAMRDWVTNVENTFYIIGTVAGPHPYPMMVRDFQSVIGRECLAQMPEAAGRQPDAVIACVGGGSNAMGIFHPYMPHAGVKLDRRRSGGRGHRDRPPCGVADGGPARRAARQPHVPAAGRERPDHRDAFGLGGPRLSGRRPRARVAQGHRPRRVRVDHRRRSARGVPRAAAASRASFRRSSRRTRSRTRRSSRRRCRRTRSCSSISPAAATRTWTRSPSARHQRAGDASTARREPHRRDVRSARAPRAARRSFPTSRPAIRRSRRRARSCTRSSTRAPTSSSSACRSPIRWPTAR